MTKTLAILLLALSATPATAAPATARAVVRTADLDLSSADGKRALDHRLARAVIEVCGTAWDADVAGKNEVRRCRAEVKARFMAVRDQRLAAAKVEPVALATR